MPLLLVAFSLMLGLMGWSPLPLLLLPPVLVGVAVAGGAIFAAPTCCPASLSSGVLARWRPILP